MIKQRTIKNQIEASGVGLHSGNRVLMVLRPGEENNGIRFRRVDLSTSEQIVISPQAVVDTKMCSCIEQITTNGKIRISTIEHLMSALYALGIDNINIDLNAEEVPILDGSAMPFLFLLRSAEVVEQSINKQFIKIIEPIEVKDGDKWARLDPYDGCSFSFSIEFAHPVIGKTANATSFDFVKNQYSDDIARARTFGFTKEVEWLRENGLARGGGLENAIVLDEYKVLNAEGLRYSDEFVRHKILDAIGDLYVLGHPILCAFSANKSGHALNNLLAREVMNRKQSWQYLESTNDSANLQSWFGNVSVN